MLVGVVGITVSASFFVFLVDDFRLDRAKESPG